jgi:ABC-2 type transport system permease protein
MTPMRRLLHLVRLYLRLLTVHQRAQLEYRADLIIGIFGILLSQLANFAFVWILFSRIPNIAGWTLWEAAFLYSLLILPRGLADFLCDGPWQLSYMVHRGEFDRVLLRPVPVVLQIVTQASAIHGVGHFILGGYILATASQRLGYDWSLERILFLALTLVCSLVILGSLSLAANSIAFWQKGESNRLALFVLMAGDTVQVPLSAYGRGIRLLVTWVLPYAFVSYYPACVLLGKPLAHPWMGYGAPVAAFVMAMIAWLLCRLGVRSYVSPGH